MLNCLWYHWPFLLHSYDDTQMRKLKKIARKIKKSSALSDYIRDHCCKRILLFPSTRWVYAYYTVESILAAKEHLIAMQTDAVSYVKLSSCL